VVVGASPGVVVVVAGTGVVGRSVVGVESFNVGTAVQAVRTAVAAAKAARRVSGPIPNRLRLAIRYPYFGI
jgi:hypothetical protein